LENIPYKQEEWLDGHKMEAAWLYMTGTCSTCLSEGSGA
jgi:hypothetical protein